MAVPIIGCLGIAIAGVKTLDAVVQRLVVLENLMKKIAILLMERDLVFIRMMHNVPVRMFF